MLGLNAFAKQVREPDKKPAPVAAKGVVKTVAKLVKPAIVGIVVVPDVKRGSGIWTPAKEDLRVYRSINSFVIQSGP